MEANGKAIGRPRALTLEKQDAVVRLITLGVSRKLAAKFVDVDVSTIANEAARNPAFFDRLTAAEEESLSHHLTKVKASKDWKASAWFLARRWPDEFASPPKHHKVEGMFSEPLTEQQRQRAIDAIVQERFGDVNAQHSQDG